MKFGPHVISEENAVEEDIKVNGPLKVHHNLKIKRLVVNGPVKIGKTLEIEKEGSLLVNGPISIENNLLCKGEARVNGPLRVKNEINGGLFKINGSLESSNLNVISIIIKGDVDIVNDFIAKEFIELSISPKAILNIGGLIEAPIVILRARGEKNLGSIVKSLIGMKDKTIINLSGIKIKTDLLQLYGINVEGEIDAKKMEKLS